ncbi:MAG: 4Fe-4S dicluster domain-containing protein [Ignavibacteria bacterium]|nr:4Fe-4S dicluster domain-containing protein [Ignavibacteria bacterium]
MINRRNFLKIVSFGGGIALASKITFELTSQENNNEHKIEGLKAKRWAMAIDVQKCDRTPDCKECVVACHNYHNVPNFDNPKDEIKWIWKDKFHNAFITQENIYLPSGMNHQTVLLLCNHCDKPPCTNVCPTQATWKREDGIVMMDWHRCIGCRYCIAACPYGSRSFNWKDPRPYIKNLNPDFPTRTRGVVEKCTFCAERLARGQMPACVVACPSKALFFGDLSDPGSEIRQVLSERFSIRRKPELSTSPEVYYLV